MFDYKMKVSVKLLKYPILNIDIHVKYQNQKISYQWRYSNQYKTKCFNNAKDNSINSLFVVTLLTETNIIKSYFHHPHLFTP